MENELKKLNVLATQTAMWELAAKAERARHRRERREPKIVGGFCFFCTTVAVLAIVYLACIILF